MEVQCHPGDYQRGQYVPAPKVARKRPLNVAYRELRARYRALAASTKKQIDALQRKADEGEMSGMCIMECRDVIERELGVNCARLPGLNISSPFFDDIVTGLVHAVKYYHGQVMKHVSSPALQAMQTMQNAPQNAMMSLAQVQQLLAHQQIQNATASAAWNQTPSTNPVCQTIMGGTTTPMTNTVWVTTGGAATVTAVVNTSTGQATLGTPTAAGVMGFGTGATNSLAPPSDMYLEWADVNLEIKDGQKRRIKLPDGAIIETQVDGSYTINDADAKVIYRANRVREFNRFINASDLMAQFVEFCGKEAGVGRNEFLDLPLKLFIGYLIVEAAKADGEPEPKDIKLLPDLRDWVDKYQQQTHQLAEAAA